MQEESNGELAFFLHLLKRSNGIFLALSCKKPSNTEQYINYNSNTVKLQRKRSSFPSLQELIQL